MAGSSFLFLLLAATSEKKAQAAAPCARKQTQEGWTDVKKKKEIRHLANSYRQVRQHQQLRNRTSTRRHVVEFPIIVFSEKKPGVKFKNRIRVSLRAGVSKITTGREIYGF